MFVYIISCLLVFAFVFSLGGSVCKLRVPSSFFALQYVMVILKGGVPMSFGGSEEPTAYGELVSIGGLTPDKNKQLSAALAEILQSKLSVQPSRFYIKFYDVKVSK